ncbi:hypothetical protein BG842_09805 [Haladaptatus sp. W1]|uniref:hypothetical protein n=1 Tax=Haladaptatus sp. W1 TaxID=1897478 RepID=UPI000849D45E|nr:hypothetical protein [Haladaptatus sp. W1]ODR79310.1 hypothetical protein BG842_09805 [Haladaptatus sp. W1]
MTRVSQATVLRHWLELEQRKPNAPSADLGALSERELLDRLLHLKPGVASFIWREKPISWYRLTLSRRSFERLRVADGPDDLSWRALSPDETILGAARRVAGGDPDALAAETGVDISRVLSFRENPPDEPLVAVDRRDCRPPRVVDGNHRATARALRLVEIGTYDPVRVYLARCSRPLLPHVRRRTCSVVRRLRGRRTW